MRRTNPPFELPYQSAFSKRESLVKEVRMNEKATHYNKPRNSIKTSSPPKAISLDSSYLSDRIGSLQNLTLVGRCHFPEMDDVAMRKWLDERWKPFIGYTPIISRLMKEWYFFHFLKASNLEAVLKSP